MSSDSDARFEGFEVDEQKALRAFANFFFFALLMFHLSWLKVVIFESWHISLTRCLRLASKRLKVNASKSMRKGKKQLKIT